MSRAVDLLHQFGDHFETGTKEWAEFSIAQLEAFYHAARAEALREAADVVASNDSAIAEEMLRAMADREGK